MVGVEVDSAGAGASPCSGTGAGVLSIAKDVCGEATSSSSRTSAYPPCCEEKLPSSVFFFFMNTDLTGASTVEHPDSYIVI